jgi:hypothetical protein
MLPQTKSSGSFAANQQALAQYALAHCAGFFSDALAGDVTHGSINLNSFQAECLKTKSRDQARRLSRHSAACGAGAHPVTKVRHLMHAVNEVQTYATKKSASRFVENTEAVPFVISLFSTTRSDEFRGLFNRVVRMTPR